jgi:alpha-amylase
MLPPTNGVMMQYFHWYNAADGQFWNELASAAEHLAAAGVTSLWLPPAFKGVGGAFEVGYGAYDFYDLGEFDQKGTVRTKYGTKEEYLNAVRVARGLGLRVYADVVFNHMLGADEEEEFEAIAIDPDDRTKPLSDYHTIKSWTKFTFPGRAGKYSDMKWNWWHFSAVDSNSLNPDYDAVYLVKGKEFDGEVDLEKGNFDYLMGCDLDINHPEVSEELKRWGEWYINLTEVDGFRFDAVKHVNASAFCDWLNHLRSYAKRDVFAVGEYWSYEVEALHSFIESTNGDIMLFDAPLHYNFHKASQSGNTYDMRTIFDGTLVQEQPSLAVTLVENHDSQPLQSLESVVEPWFKPLAYALILLRSEGYPCIFYADYYGAHYKDTGTDGNEVEVWLESFQEVIDVMLKARKNHLFGEQRTYFDHSNTIGWVLCGDAQHEGGMAVLLSNGDEGYKSMEVGQKNRVYQDLLGYCTHEVTTNEEGWGDFHCNAGSVSIWVPK